MQSMSVEAIALLRETARRFVRNHLDDWSYDSARLSWIGAQAV